MLHILTVAKEFKEKFDLSKQVKNALEMKKAEYDALSRKKKSAIKKILKANPALISAISASDSPVTLQMILDINKQKGIKKFAANISTTMALLTPSKAYKDLTPETSEAKTSGDTESSDEVKIELPVDTAVVDAVVVDAPVVDEPKKANVSKYESHVQAMKSAKEQNPDLAFTSEFMLNAIVAKHPVLAPVVSAEKAAVNAKMVLEIKKQGGLKTFVANVKNGFMQTFDATWAGLDESRRVQLAKMDSKKFSQLQAFFACAKETGNNIVVGQYVDALAQLNDEEFTSALNLDPSYLSLVFIEKTHSLSDTLKVEKKVTDENTPTTYKQEVVKTEFNLNAGKDYVKACIEVAKKQANKINHWYYWNGRSKASEIFAAISAIETNYLNDKPGSIKGFDANYILKSFKAENGKSLTEALDTHRHHSFFRSATKKTNSIKLFEKVEAPKIK